MPETDTAPLVLIAFNRPGHLRRQLEAIRQSWSGKILAIVDGPRSDRAGEERLVQEVNQLLEGLRTGFNLEIDRSPRNLGCYKRIKTGLDWVFSKTDKAIILEDDCIPDPEFFAFCDELLIRYKDTATVGSIQGTNFGTGHDYGNNSYKFSRYNLFWGWATWKRAWDRFDDFDDAEGADRIDCAINANLKRLKERMYWRYIKRSILSGKINSWGYRWIFSCWNAGMLSATPCTSMINNTGLAGQATHTGRSAYNRMYTGDRLAFPLTHPPCVARSEDLDYHIEDTLYSRSIYNRIKWLYRRMRR